MPSDMPETLPQPFMEFRGLPEAQRENQTSKRISARGNAKYASAADSSGESPAAFSMR